MKIATVAISAIAALTSGIVVHGASPAAAAADDAKSSVRNLRVPSRTGPRGNVYIPQKGVSGIDQGDGGNTIVIVGGVEVDPPRKYPFFVSIGGCGGSLIAPNLVLSAAHCAPLNPNTVTLGLHLRNPINDADELEHREIIEVKDDIVHPAYNSATMDNDFWIIELKWSTQKYVDYVVGLDRPSAEDGLDLDIGDHALAVMGFGTLTSGGSTPDVLQEVEVDYLPTSATGSCGSYGAGQITDTMMCAGRTGKDSCQGDSGGPIVDVTTELQVGVVSWGIGCANPSYPGVYSRVSSGFGWISGIIDELSDVIAPPPPPVPCPDDLSEWDGMVVQVTVLTDNYPSETYWEINPTCPGSNLGSHSSPSYDSPNTSTTTNVCVPYGIYDFVIEDTYGDGICCSYGSGSYVITVDGVEVHSGGEFDAEETKIIGDSCQTPSTPPPNTAPTTPPPTGTAPTTPPPTGTAPTTPPPTGTAPTTPPPTTTSTTYLPTTYLPTTYLPTDTTSPNVDTTPPPPPPPVDPTCVEIIVDIQMDMHPGQISWTLANECTGETVITGPRISSPNTLFSGTFCLPPDSYQFLISDSIGGGLTGSGSYVVTYDGVEVAAGAQFDNSEATFMGNGSGCP